MSSSSAAAAVRPVPDGVVVRAGHAWWVLAAIGVGMDVAFTAMFGLRAATEVDRATAPAFAGAFAAGCLAVLTSRWEVRGRVLVGIGAWRVFRIDADQLSGFDDENGLSVVLRSGYRIELGICQASLAQFVIGNRRRRREAGRLREWLQAVRPTATAGWEPSEWRSEIRWRAVLAVPASALASLVLAEVLGLLWGW